MGYTAAGFPGVHFPGSIPLPDEDAVFDWIGDEVCQWVRRVPDGETGLRAMWVGSAMPQFAENPTLEAVDVQGPVPFPQFRPREGVTVTFPPLQYSDWARSSYRTFAAKRAEGILPGGTKFMVGLPHPMDTVRIFCTGGSFDELYGPFEEQTRQSLEDIVDGIPHQDLSIQWELPMATNFYCGVDDSVMGRVVYRETAEVLDVVLRVAGWVPDDVELGFHLCFGDRSSSEEQIMGDIDIDESANRDTSGLTRFVNDLHRGVDRDIAFVHLPTEEPWLEPQHFEPLREMELGSETDVSVGTINLRRDADEPLEVGVERARDRTEVVRGLIGPVGVATSCGMGRYTPEQFTAATELYRELASSATT